MDRCIEVGFPSFSTSWARTNTFVICSKDATTAATIMPFIVIMCELFNGILRPQSQMPVLWKYTMYYITPFTYWIGGILSTVVSGQTIVCSEPDLNFFVPPPGQTCGEYAGSWLSATTGYLVDPNATSQCGYCKYSVADDVSQSISAINFDPRY